jgi:hypothetical protein
VIAPGHGRAHFQYTPKSLHAPFSRQALRWSQLRFVDIVILILDAVDRFVLIDKTVQ